MDGTKTNGGTIVGKNLTANFFHHSLLKAGGKINAASLNRDEERQRKLVEHDQRIKVGLKDNTFCIKM